MSRVCESCVRFVCAIHECESSMRVVYESRLCESCVRVVCASRVCDSTDGGHDDIAQAADSRQVSRAGVSDGDGTIRL